MYDFIDVNQTPSAVALPSEAMTFNGKVFESEIKGYRTLSVSGREMIGKNVSGQNVDGLDGTIFMGSSYPSRVITVKYQLRTDSSTDFRSKFNKLNQLLSKEESVFKFADEPNYEFIGTLSDVGDVKEGSLEVVSSFSITCSDPYKYKTADVISGLGTVTIENKLFYNTLPAEIKITPKSQTNTLTIKNVTKNKTIKLVDTFLLDVPVYVYPEAQEIKRNGINYPNFLVWTSDFENFTISENDVITVTPSSDIEIKIREMML